MTPRYPVKNSTNVLWIDTHRVTLAEFEADVSYPLETLHQGRDAQNRVPHFSPMSGKPDQDDVDNEARAIFWRSYVATLALVALCAVILANWPN
jgi:anti-sigma-K factor RskA